MNDTQTTESPAASSTRQEDFDSTVTLTAAPEVVFDALTTPVGLAGWWAPVTGDCLAGGELTFTFGGTTAIMRVDEADRPSTVRWTTMVCEPLPDWVGSTLNFTISADGSGGSVLHFRHAGLRVLECFDMCSNAWTGYLRSLADYVESGTGTPFGSAAK